MCGNNNDDDDDDSGALALAVALSLAFGNLKSFLCENFENSCALLSFAIVPLTGIAASEHTLHTLSSAIAIAIANAQRHFLRIAFVTHSIRFGSSSVFAGQVQGCKSGCAQQALLSGLGFGLGCARRRHELHPGWGTTSRHSGRHHQATEKSTLQLVRCPRMCHSAF